MKKNSWKITAVISAVLFCVGVCVVWYAFSPYHPRGISDSDVADNGTEYKVKLSGIYSYEENGFTPVINNFRWFDDKVYVFVGEDGYAYTDDTEKSSVSVDGSYSSVYVDYGDYEFCGETYKNQRELEAFFETPDRIYNFDINNLSSYVQDIITYEKKFYGEATVKIYRKRCVITEIYIDGEKILVRNNNE